MWTWRDSLLLFPIGFIVIGTIFGNLLVLYAFFTRPKDLRSPTHFFIANLAFTDFLVGILVMPSLATLYLTGIWHFGQTYCLIWTMTHFTLCGSSILSTTAVCIERYIGVRFPLKYKDIMTKPRIGGMIGGVWAIAIFLMLTSLFIWTEPYNGDEWDCQVNRQIGHVILAVVGTLYIPGILMMVLYWRIYRIATSHFNILRKKSMIPTKSSSQETQDSGFGFKKYINKSTSGNSTSGSVDIEVSSSSSSGLVKSSFDDVHSAQIKKQINLAKRLGLLVGILLVSYGLPFSLNFYMALHPGVVAEKVFYTLAWLRYSNSCINVIIYAYAVPAYRKAMSSILFKTIAK